MAAKELENILATRQKLAELRASNFECVQAIKGADGAKFDIEKFVPGIDRNLSEVDTRVLGLIDLIASFEGIENVTLVPTVYLANLQSHFTQLLDQHEALKNSFDAIDNEGGPGNLDPDGFTVQSQNGEANINLANDFVQFNNLTEAALQDYYLLSIILRGQGYHDFSTAFGEFSRQLQGLRKAPAEIEQLVTQAKVELEQLLDEFKTEHGNIGALQEQASNLQSEIDRLKTEAEKDRKSISEYYSESTDKVTAIRSTADQAEELRGTVEGYQKQFDQFQAQLDQRVETFEQGKAEQDRLLEKLKEFETEIDRLKTQAEDMLMGATVAGLASSFGTIRDKLTEQLDSARRNFYLAIVILFVSVLPLVAYVVPGLSLIGPAPEEASTIEFIGQIFIRALLLLPAAWFAKFAAARHAALFRLKEHYAYKYSVASSVEGFKKQAEPFKDAIAAAAFFELTFNPATRMDAKGHEERHPNPVMDWVMKKLGTTYDGKSS